MRMRTPISGEATMRNKIFCRVSIREIAKKGAAVVGDSAKCGLRPR
jgi:ribosomal protein S14